VSGKSLSERVGEISPEGCFGLLFGEAIARAAAMLREIGAEEEIIWQCCKGALTTLLTMMNETDHEARHADSRDRLGQLRKRLADGTWLH
jgi:hypothetical protein